MKKRISREGYLILVQVPKYERKLSVIISINEGIYASKYSVSLRGALVDGNDSIDCLVRTLPCVNWLSDFYLPFKILQPFSASEGYYVITWIYNERTPKVVAFTIKVDHLSRVQMGFVPLFQLRRFKTQNIM